MSRRRNRDTRPAVYKLLVDGIAPNSGLSIPRAAKQLGISEQAVRVHADSLEADGIIARIPGKNRPVLYKRGPRSNTLDTVILPAKTRTTTRNDGGTVDRKDDALSRLQPPVVISDTAPCSVRAHPNGRAIFSVLHKGDMCPLRIPGEHGEKLEVRVFEDEPYFESRGVQMWKGKLPYNGGEVSIEYLETATKKQLHVWPPECELVPQQFKQAGQIMEALAQDAANFLCKHGGWSLGLIQFRGRIELASTDERILANIPEDMKGKPGSPLWIDCSTGPREIEVSADDYEAGEAVFDFPGTTARLNGRMDALDVRMDRLMGITEKMETVTERLAQAVATLAEMRAIDLQHPLEQAAEVMFG